jgi:hypothetical protein
MTYAFFDGDNIGISMEILLTENRVFEAQKFSQNISSAMKEIRKILSSISDINIIILGGDDIFLEYNSFTTELFFIEDIRRIFKEITGNSMSCGIGKTPAESIRNLYLAKLYGKDRVKGL